MKKIFLFLFILISACTSPAYIGETEKEYCSKNNIKREKLFILYINGDSTFGYGKYNGEIPFNHLIIKKHDTTVYTVPDRNKHIQYLIYTFKNGICVGVDTVFKREEVRYL